MKKRIVCLGDSITWGFPWGPDVSWVSMLNQAIEDAEFINMGVNGNTTGDMLRCFERVLRHNPTHVVIMGGINDVICGESFDRISGNIRELAEKSENAGLKVIMGLPTVVDDPFFEVLLLRLREWMLNYAREKNLPVIPFHQAFYNHEGEIRTELLLPDGGHPTVEGYREMYKQIDQSVFA